MNLNSDTKESPTLPGRGSTTINLTVIVYHDGQTGKTLITEVKQIKVDGPASAELLKEIQYPLALILEGCKGISINEPKAA